MSETDAEQPIHLASLVWTDADTGQTRDYPLIEGATATIGRLADNDICIRERHVSRRHAVISYRDGIFTINDLGSANGTFVNDKRLLGLFPLAAGDRIRLFVPTLVFCAAGSGARPPAEVAHPTVMPPAEPPGQCRLVITAGTQEGEVIPLAQLHMTVGRSTAELQWEIALRDPAVSRTHARLELGVDQVWRLFDLGSSNGTLVNGIVVDITGHALTDGDVITFGSTVALFRAQ